MVSYNIWTKESTYLLERVKNSDLLSIKLNTRVIKETFTQLASLLKVVAVLTTIIILQITQAQTKSSLSTTRPTSHQRSALQSCSHGLLSD